MSETPIQKLCNFLSRRRNIIDNPAGVRGAKPLPVPELPNEAMTYADALSFSIALDRRIERQLDEMRRLNSMSQSSAHAAFQRTRSTRKALDEVNTLISNINTSKLQQEIVDSINKMQIRPPARK